MRIFSRFVILVVLFFSFAHPIFAAYVLPYPSYMPGNKLYKVSRVVDVVKGWWSWGSIAQLKYHMALADKYLVEAKTLFEYQQYPLALDALARSDKEILYLKPFIDRAEKEGKDMLAFKQIVDDAMTVHKKILTEIKKTVPETFTWQPEKAQEEELMLHMRLQYSYEIR